MIIDLEKFIADEKQYWDELDRFVGRLRAVGELSIDELKRFHYLYRRTASDLAKLTTFAFDPELQQYLENLIARSYTHLHGSRSRTRFRPLYWLLVAFPRTVRKHSRALLLSLALTLVGAMFGSFALTIDPHAKAVLIPPMPHLSGDPNQRVAREEEEADYRGGYASGTAFYFTHNSKVAFTALALGLTYGIGTIVLLFYNGAILGAVIADYFIAGQGTFVVGWLLPHGSVEITAILIAGQAGLVLAHALIGWGRRVSLVQRLRMVRGDLMILAFGVSFMMLWAGGVESWFSQTHAPVFPYAFKIAFGVVQLVIVVMFLSLSGRGADSDEEARVE